jgi:hypothetical protein
MIFQSSMGLGKSRRDIPSGTTQGQDYLFQILVQCVYMQKQRERREKTSKVVNIICMWLATKDGSYPTIVNYSIWNVFIGNLWIPCNNLYVCGV